MQAKNIFGTTHNSRFTIDLLESFFDLDRGSLKGLKITNSVKLLENIIAGKEIEMDIMVKLPDKTKINLEFYSSYSLPKEIKSSMYITKEYSGQLAKGEDYNLIKKVEQINFINRDTLRKDDKAIKTFCLIDKENLSNKMLEEYLELTIVNVASVKQKVYNKGNKNFELWRQFIGAKTKK